MNASPAAETDIPAIVALLAASGLPSSDVLPDSHPEFLVVRDRGDVVGVVGLERFGDTALLRSLVVRPAHRGRGLGILLVRALEQHVRDRGVLSLILLTKTAEQFFRERGYSVVARTEAPPAVQASTEFRSLCPSSAICMRKRLAT